MVSSDILLKLKTSYTLKCLLTTNFQLMTFLNTSGTKKTVSSIYRVGHKKRNQILMAEKKNTAFSYDLLKIKKLYQRFTTSG